jgi:putative endonuclease
MKKGYIYILSNYKRTTFYIGVTTNIELRFQQHRNGTGSKFTEKYKLHVLVYFEEYQSIQLAIAREKQLKNWHRDWKIALIKSVNPRMKDLSER